MPRTFTGLGLMSGTSLDGLDICCVEFRGDMMPDTWTYRVLAATTVPYTDDWRKRLAEATTLSGLKLITLHIDYAHLMGKEIQKFLMDNPKLELDFVATHGHTVFHQPDDHITFQLGEGEILATYLRWPLVCNFRMKDVALQGQGAPFAPSGERYLYPEVALCLNLGGIANVGARKGKAWDVCPCNTILNRLAKKADPSAQFDKDGELAKGGTVRSDVLEKLEELDFYSKTPPKSLSVEWIDSNLWPILDNVMQDNPHSLPDLARTCVQHIAVQVASACEEAVRTAAASPSKLPAVDEHRESAPKVLVTGGGAHNRFLMCEIQKQLEIRSIEIEEADPYTIDYKEAIIFAFLGLRCLIGKENVFADTTGARANSVSGSIHQPCIETSKTVGYKNSHFRFLLSSEVTTSAI